MYTKQVAEHDGCNISICTDESDSKHTTQATKTPLALCNGIVYDCNHIITVTLLWIPGHEDIEGKELPRQLALNPPAVPNPSKMRLDVQGATRREVQTHRENGHLSSQSHSVHSIQKKNAHPPKTGVCSVLVCTLPIPRLTE